MAFEQIEYKLCSCKEMNTGYQCYKISNYSAFIPAVEIKWLHDNKSLLGKLASSQPGGGGSPGRLYGVEAAVDSSPTDWKSQVVWIRESIDFFWLAHL